MSLWLRNKDKKQETGTSNTAEAAGASTTNTAKAAGASTTKTAGAVVPPADDALEFEAVTSPFALVCDSACDIPMQRLEDAGVACVPLVVKMGTQIMRDGYGLGAQEYYNLYPMLKGKVGTLSPEVADFITVYKKLIAQGANYIISCHVSTDMRDAARIAQEAASKVMTEHPEVKIKVLDSHATSAQLALILCRLIADRDEGVAPKEAYARAWRVAEASRFLVVPSRSVKMSYGLGHKSKGILGQVSTLGHRARGTYSLVCFQGIVDGKVEVKELTRAVTLSRLAGIAARTMSLYSHEVGPLTCIEVVAGKPGNLAIMEKPLDTNEFESECAAVLNTNPTTTNQLGLGAVGIAYVPSSLLSVHEVSHCLRYRVHNKNHTKG